MCSHLAPELLPFGIPKFDLKEMGVDIAGLLIATGVLVQQSRQDMPNIRDRYDWEAQIMQEATDPQVVINILQENLEQSETELSQSN